MYQKLYQYMYIMSFVFPSLINCVIIHAHKHFRVTTHAHKRVSITTYTPAYTLMSYTKLRQYYHPNV